MLHMFKDFIRRSAPIIKGATWFASANVATVALTHFAIRDEPPEKRAIYWENYMDPEGCRTALTDHQKKTDHNKLK